MKLSKRSVLLLACLLTATALTVAGTMAYLTDTASLTNTFTVGKVQIGLDEADVKPDGTPETDPDTNLPLRTDEGNDYHLLPGNVYTKDPTTTVKAGSEASYIRMKVTVTKYAEIQAAFAEHGKTFVPGEWVEGFDPTKWVPVTPAATDADDNLVLEYRYHETVATMDPREDRVLQALFTKFSVPEFLSGDNMTQLEGMKILVRSEAMQAAGFATADEAWKAFDEATSPAAGQQPPQQPEQPEQPGDQTQTETGN